MVSPDSSGSLESDLAPCASDSLSVQQRGVPNSLQGPSALTSDNKKLCCVRQQTACLSGFPRAFLRWGGLTSAVVSSEPQACRGLGVLPGPWGTEHQVSRAALPGESMPGLRQPSGGPSVRAVRTNTSIASGLVMSLSGFGIEQAWPVCVIKTEMVWLGTLAQWPRPQQRSLWQQLNRVPRA